MLKAQDAKLLSVFFDCRCDAEDGRGYDTFRHVTHEQCSRLLSMASLHDTRPSLLSVSLHLVFHTHIRTYEPALAAPTEATCHPWLAVIERLNVEAVHSPRFSSSTERSAFVNRMAMVKTAVEGALRGGPRSHLVIFCSTYVSPTQAVQSLADVRTGPLPQQICCILPDWAAVRVTAAYIHERLRLYRCSFNPTLLQCALQDALGPYVLPGIPPAHRVKLQLGNRELSCRATVMHYADSIRRYGYHKNFPSTHVIPAGGGSAGAECVRHGAVTLEAEAGPSVLQLRALLQADEVDEAMLYGDTWELTWEGDCGNSAADSATVSSLAAYTNFHTFRTAFRDDVLVFTGDTQGVMSSCHFAMRHHHYVVYDSHDKTMRLRELVPTELRFVPLKPPLPRVGDCGGRPQEDPAIQRQLSDLRARLVAQSTTADFSLDSLLRAELCTVAKEARHDTVR
ncbi:hypothetical protein ABL78_3780 [Leptomonas seymouri]|uniref:Uncharacterized protein n=1 Tax=Leptomonas seymouri TaxID=5684 RepID=A0A0N0P6G3_LEPSE|nr:hypothetical protein ABL78_3780 [Leptomonas seymouri]|eukprot:KPI87127.1 hypothetical protein ABL78_3780 [Leptomonas seymouri]